MKKIIFTFFAILSLVILPRISFAATVLTAGDIVIITANSDDSYVGGINSNGFDFVSKVDLSAGTRIYFTDKGWDGSLAIPFWKNTSGEGLVRYTVPAGGVTKGTVIHYDDTLLPSLPSSGSGMWDMYSINTSTGVLTLSPSVLSSLVFDISTAGDTILAFQDPTNTNSAATPVFVTGIGLSGTTNWISSGTPTANNSWIPAGLSVVGGTIVSLGSVDNYQYTCSVTGLFSANLSSSLQTPANWSSSDTVPYGISPCVFDTSLPSVTINQSIGQNDPTNNSAINFTAVFSEAINPITFSNTDINLTGTGLATVGTPVTSDNITWTIPVTATSAGTIIAGINGGLVTDINGNPNITSTSTDASVTYDNTAPVIAEVVPITTPTNDNTPNYTFSSTKDGLIAFAGGCSSSTATAVVGNNTITLNALADGTYGSCTVSVTDMAGNISTALTITPFTVDTAAPAVAITSPTNGTITGLSLNLLGTCETGLLVTISGTGFTSTPITTTCLGGTFSKLLTVTGNVSVLASQIDSAGNTGTSSPAKTFIADLISPVLVITTASPSVSANFTVTISPNEPITGFTLSDINVVNGTASNLVGPNGSGDYSVTITPITSGNVTIQILAASIVDSVNNTNIASNIVTVNYSLPITNNNQTTSSGGVLYCNEKVTTFCRKKSDIQPGISINQSSESLGMKGRCSAKLILTQDMRSGARDGRVNNYSKITIARKEILTEVKILQKHMNRLGFNSGKEDGILGILTDGAIKRMQKFLGTQQDGMIGSNTRALINNSCGS